MLKITAVPQKEEELAAPHLGYFIKPGVRCGILDETGDVLVNPGKGWCIHYFDNTLSCYGDRLEHDDLEDFDGFTTVYLRLAWSYLEPEEGKFNWEVIDAPIRRWTKLGKRIAFRISCCEGGPSQPYATPKWVFDAGAASIPFGQGGFEPDYGDPVFLEKLNNFLQAFAARYDGQPWIDYIDISSYGIWGEWHTSSSSKRVWPVEVRKAIVDLNAKAFKKSQLFILYGAGKEVCDYARKTAGAGLRTDSVGVYSYYTEFGGFWTEKIYPALDAGHFEDFWREYPTLIEPAHYRHVLQYNTWQNGSVLESAVRTLHSSWTTCHHWPREFLNENRDLVRRLANLMGYWLFLKVVSAPEKVKRGENFETQMIWENRGVAPVYKDCFLTLSLADENGVEVFRSLHPSVKAHRWMPGKTEVLMPRWQIPASLPAGKYQLRFGLLSSLDDAAAPIRIGAKSSGADNFVQIAPVELF